MGCFASRLDKRRDQAQDYNVTPLAFLGGNADELWDKFPFDRVQQAYDNTKKADWVAAEADWVAGNEDQVKTIYKSTIEALDTQSKALTEKYGSAADSKTVYYLNKYTAADAVTQMKDTLEHLKKNSGLEAAPAEAAPAEMEGAGEMEGGENETQYDGGEDDAMMEAAMGGDMVDADAGAKAMEEVPNPNKYDGDSKSYEGWNQFGAALLRNAIVNPVFGDLLKAHALEAEFQPEKATNAGLTGAAALVSAAAAKAVTGENEVWLSGYLSSEYVESLNDIVASEGKNIHFPFVSFGWGSKEEAIQALSHIPVEKKDNYTSVLFEVTKAPAAKFCECRQVVHRLNGTLSSGEKIDQTVVYKIEAKALEEQTVEAWEAAVKAAAEAPAAVAAATEGENKPMEGAMEGDNAMMEEAKME